MAKEQYSVKERLILEGIRSIGESGIHGLSMRRIAKACNVSSAAPFKHFPDKQAFLHAIAQYITDQWYARQDRMPSMEHLSSKERLVHMIMDFVRFLAENPQYIQVILLRDKNRMEHRDQISTRSQRLIRQYAADIGAAEEEVLQKTFMIRAMIFGSAMLFASGEQAPTEDKFALMERAVSQTLEAR